MSTIFDAIVAAERQFMAFYDGRDASSLAAMYTDDALIMPPNQPTVEGNDNREALFKSFWDEGLTKIELDTKEVAGAGEAAYEVGDYRLFDDRAELKDQGRYIVIWKQEKLIWKLHRDIFNSSLPAETPGPGGPHA